MSTALHAVAWRDVLGELLEALPDLCGPVADQVAAAQVTTGCTLKPFNAALALLATHGGPERCAVAVERNGGSRATGEWLYRTGRTAVRLLQPDVRPVPAVPPGPAAGPWLTVEDDLGQLPLLDLADAYAARARRHILVRRADVAPLAGRAGPFAGVTLVEIDYVLTPTTWSAVWHHEFGHVVDPHQIGRSAVDQETYADAFARLTQAGPPPATLDHLDQLIRWADDCTPPPAPADVTPAPPTGGDFLPEDGVPSLYLFAALPLAR